MEDPKFISGLNVTVRACYEARSCKADQVGNSIQVLAEQFMKES